jgi:hypothetical protein
MSGIINQVGARSGVISGIITHPQNPYSVYNNSPGWSTGDLTGGTLVSENGMTYTSATGRWTAPVAGLYMMGMTAYTSGSTTMEIYIKKDGTSLNYLNNLTNPLNAWGHSVSTVIVLAKGNEVNFANGKGAIRAGNEIRWVYLIS